MRRSARFGITCGAFIAGSMLAILGIPDTASAQARADQPFPAYNPYPRRILPADLDAEIARVRREVRSIFDQALKEWKALPPLSPAGNPPTLRAAVTKPWKYSGSC
jgi:hypothetical protein